MKNINKDNRWLITIDLDGTFLSSGKHGQENHEFSNKNLEVIKKLMKLDHKVAIVTGRPWKDAKIIYEKMNLKTIIANYNGAYIHYPYKKTFTPVIYSINSEILEMVFKEPIIKKVCESVIIEAINNTYASENGKDFYWRIMNLRDKKNVVIWNLGDKILEDPQNVMIGINLNKGVDPVEILYILKRNYGNSLFFRLWDGRNEKNNKEPWVMLEINQKASNKGTAMKYIASYYNIPLSRTISFGDGMNDREMLIDASVGVAMKNSMTAVKTYADDITDFTNDESGVGKYLEDFFDLN